MMRDNPIWAILVLGVVVATGIDQGIDMRDDLRSETAAVGTALDRAAATPPGVTW